MSSLGLVARRTVHPERLRLARNLRGLSQKDVAERVGVSAPSISQYEAGGILPTGETVSRLALTLAVSPDFFAQPRTASAVGAPFFRSLRSTPQRSRDQAKAYAKLIAEIADAFEQLVEFPRADFELGVRLDDDDPVEAAEVAADVLRRRWDLPDGPVGHVVRTIEHHGAVSSAVAELDDKLDAFTLRTRRRPVVVLCSQKGVATRRRFDAAHELAHLVLHDKPLEANRHQEAQAHRFASAFLMPAETVSPWLITSPKQLAILEDGARTWGVSMQALVRRARDLGRLSEDGYSRAMRQMGALGWRTREPVDIGPPERPQLLLNAAAAVGGAGLRHVSGATGIPLAQLERILALPEDQLDAQPGMVIPLAARSA